MTVTFQHRALGQRVLVGSGQAAVHLAGEVERLGACAVMLIASSAERAARVSADIEVALAFDDVAQHVPVDTAAAARAAAAEHGIDLLVSVGGGSATGLAKVVALTSGVPIVAVPTTYAGSEATNVWGLTEQGHKQTGTDDRVLPTTIIYDAELTVGMPAALSVASGLNALAHSVDALWGPRADPINAASATEGIRALAASMPAIAADPADLEAREQALWGTYLSAAAFTSAGAGLHHKICHVLGGTHDLPHAETHAIVLPHMLAFNAVAAPEASRRIANALGSPDAVTGLVALRDRLETPTGLHEYGLAEDRLDAITERALPTVPQSNPRPVTHGDLYNLLRAAWAGDVPHAAAEPPSTQQAREQALLEQAVNSFQDTPNPRLRSLMQSLTRHLHTYLREVRLTEAEWDAAIQFLTNVGHITDDKRQEFILLSDVLGASMQTITVNNEAYGAATEATVFGPFFVEGSPRINLGADIAGDAHGEPCWVEGTITDTNGAPVPGARIEVWEADEDGFYDVQYSNQHMAGRAHLFSDEHGQFHFWGLTPTPYPIPHDGPVGQLLDATGRSPMRAAHLHFKITATGMRTLVTHIFVRGDELLDRDTVFGVRPSLVKDFTRQELGTPTPDGRDLNNQPWTRAIFNIVLAPAGS